ncbi:MAG: trypsin-like peptidase domain-containing protein [Planctomycetes bacterium]|nr:trypsin-like peptidase domain-containing protein [Planctomycetota bacterium]
MAIRVTCPSCGKSMDVGEDKRGKRVVCRGCDKPLQVSGGTRPRDNDERDYEDAIQEERRPRSRTDPGRADQRDWDDDRDSSKSRIRAGASSRDVRDRDGRDRDNRDRDSRDRDPRDRDDDGPPRRHKKSRHKSATSPLVWIFALGGGGLLLVALVVVLVISLNAPDRTTKPRFVGQPPPFVNAQPAPVKQQPDQIPVEVVERVKKATVHIKVTTPTGLMAEGSGFFAEPGLVVTNAHVLGMLQARSRMPAQATVVVNSGELNEFQLSGNVLGVDSGSDLAFLRVPETQGKMPQPLKIETSQGLRETQKVFIFGFPFGSRLGKNVTVNESSVSSLRKDAMGALDRVQCNGGMHPGNSGGPVVNGNGDLIGVSVAGIPGTPIVFAIPSDHVTRAMAGRLLDDNRREPYIDGGKVRVPVEFTFLDPMKRIKDLRVEVWTGDAGRDRPPSLVKPVASDGDSQRETHKVTYENGFASGNILLPKVPAGKVVWVQPVTTTNEKTNLWGPARAIKDLTPLERKSASLKVQFNAQEYRTLQLKSSVSTSVLKGNSKKSFAWKTELDMIERVSPDAKGAVARTGIGPLDVYFELDENKKPVDPEVTRLLKLIPPVFVLDRTNKVIDREDTEVSASVPEQIRKLIRYFYGDICNVYEAGCITMPPPNRALKAGDTWQATMPMIINLGDRVETDDLALICTYEGTRTKEGRNEALASLVGRLHGRGVMKNLIDGKVSGKMTFDLSGGFVSHAKMAIITEADIPESDLRVVGAFDIEVKRSLGNPKNLQIPQQSPPVNQILQDISDALTVGDPQTTDKKFKPGTRVKIYPVQLEVGKTYHITLKSKAFDAYLLLVDANNRILAEDNDSLGNRNARIIFHPKASGQYRIIATAFDGGMGQFYLTVMSSESTVR